MANISAPYRPTTHTEGAVGDIFENTTTGDRYRCTDVHEVRTDTVTFYYTWVRLIPSGSSSGGTASGTGVFVDEVTGDRYVLKVNDGKLTMEEV